MDTMSTNDGLAKMVVDSNGNKDVKLTQKLIGFIRHGIFTFTSQERAREIMEPNFLGVEEAIKHFGVSPSNRELATLAAVPFSEKVLIKCKHTHVLVAVFPLSIRDIRAKVPGKIFYGNELWDNQDSYFDTQAFAKERGKAGWHLVRKDVVVDSTYKSWRKQQKLLDKNEKTPSARVVI